MAENSMNKTRELDNAQRNAINVNINSVVSAGAGSGKTTVLAERFSDLLLRDKNCRVDQILTLTFTKKATVEMNDRIYKKLSAVCPEKAKDFYKANIKTLDSYCAQVAKLGCNNYGISPDFTQDNEAINENCYDMALKYLLKYRNEDVIAAIRGDDKYDDVAVNLFVKYANTYTSVVKPFDWKFYLQKQHNYISEEWIKAVNKIVDISENILKSLDVLQNGKKLSYEENLRKQIEILKNCKIPEINFSDYESEERKCFIQASYNFYKVKKNTGTNHSYDDIKEMHKELEQPVNVLFQIENYIYGEQFVLKLIPFLDEFKESVDNFKRSSGLLTFNDVSSLALDILINYPELRKVEKEKYKYIMIDEFQDNNEIQKDLLFLLSEKPERMEKGVPDVSQLVPDRLFFVGDEKQSIYKFRGAEVSVFRGLADDFRKGFLELKINYRSHQALIAAFNSIFGGYSYPPQEDDKDEPLYPGTFYSAKDIVDEKNSGIKIPSYEAVYNKVEVSEKAKKQIEECVLQTENGKLPEIYKPRVTVAMINSDEQVENTDSLLDAEMSEAVWVTDEIVKLLNEGYEENQIAILFRTLSLQPYYEKLLLKKGVSYKTEAVTKFFADGPVNDLVSYMNLIAFNTDAYSFANVLHSSYVNLSFEEIKLILSSFDRSKCLFLQNADELLDGESLKRFELAQNIYINAIDISQKENLTKLVSYLWYDAGYRYDTMLSQRKFMYNSSYDRLFELARMAEIKNLGLAEFIDYVLTFKTEKLDGVNIPFEYADGVNLLTIHKSKGLEFPVVFIVGCGKGTRQDSNSENLYFSEEFGVTVNTPKSPLSDSAENFFFEAQKNLSNRKNAAELRRLTYVAITRAEQKVYLSGKYNFTKWNNGISGSEKPVDKTIFDILKPSLSTYISDEMKIKEEFTDKCPFNFEVIKYSLKTEGFLEDASKTKILNEFKPLYDKAFVIQKEHVESPYASPSQLHDDESYTPGSSVITVDETIPFYQIDKLVNESISSDKNEPDFGYTNFGTIAHSYLECAVKQIEPHMLNREIVGLHGNENKISIVNDICRKMSDSFLQSNTGKRLMKSVSLNKFYKSEYDFRSLVSSKIITGQIDLVFENPDDDGFTIVDYKTNQKISPEMYYSQLACYRDAVSKMMNVPTSKVKCILFYLRFAKEVDITENCDKLNLDDLITNTL